MFPPGFKRSVTWRLNTARLRAKALETWQESIKAEASCELILELNPTMINSGTNKIYDSLILYFSGLVSVYIPVRLYVPVKKTDKNVRPPPSVLEERTYTPFIDRNIDFLLKSMFFS